MSAELQLLQRQKNSQLTTIHHLHLEINTLNNKKLRLEKAKQEMTKQIQHLQQNKRNFERITIEESEWKGETANKFKDIFHDSAMAQLKAYIQKIDLVIDEISDAIARISSQIENKHASLSYAGQRINHINSLISVTKQKEEARND